MPPPIPSRVCLACATLDPIAADERIWPPGRPCPTCGVAVPVTDGFPLYAPKLADTIHGFDPVFFEHLARIEATNFWFVARNVLLTGLIEKYFPNAESFLEVGCGNGFVMSAVAQRGGWKRLAGSELHPTGLSRARGRVPAQAEFVQMDARHIPASSVFDVIGAFDVIEHIDEDEMVIRAMRRAVKADGGVVIAVPQHPMLWSVIDDISHHKRRYVRGELEAKLRRNGFEPVFSTSYTSLLLPLMMLSRRRKMAETRRDEIMQETKLTGTPNAMLTAVLRIEVAATLAGMRWPAGGSRVVVARATEHAKVPSNRLRGL